METHDQITKVIDDPTAKPVLINKTIGATVDGDGVITLILGDVRPAPGQVGAGPGSHLICVTTRLALPPSAAAELAQALIKTLEQMKAIRAQNVPHAKN
jgi:hypothetical protein